MTATQTAPFGFPHTQLAFLRRMAAMTTKAVVAVLIIFMAGIIAIATAAAGLALAGVALLMGLFSRNKQDTHIHTHADGAGITLEARKTPRGWTVE